MTFKLPPYMLWRDGRPRWVPGPRLRPAFKGQDLRDASGDFLRLEPAIARAKELNNEVAAWRAGHEPTKRTKINRKSTRTFQHLFDMWIETPEFLLNAKATRDFYENKGNIFLETFGDVPVAAVGRAALKGYWRQQYSERGHHMANALIATARAMLTFATDLEWIDVNPAFKLKLKTPQPRLAIWLPLEINAFVAAADASEMHHVGDAVIAALHSGQRQADVLVLPLRLFDDQRIRLSQAKMRGKARIDAPMTLALASRVADIRARRAAMSNVIDIAAPLIVRANGQPYSAEDEGDAFRREFRAVKTLAVAGSEELGLPQCPSLAALRFQDLRDTAVTRLASADCNLAEIAAITGHEIASITGIIKHYLVLQPAMADAAIDKLSRWLEKHGIAI